MNVTMEVKPLQIVPSSLNISVDEEKSVVEVKEELEKSSSSIVEHKCCLFTEVQRCELDYQVSIFNHFAYNLPLPHHLLQFSTNMPGSFVSFAEYTHLGYDHGAMKDPEPNRCRRTDGKKWRCSKNTVPNQKYCESHMHRGRNRSRKPVEISQLNSPLTTKPYDKSFTLPTPNPLVTIVAPNATTYGNVATVTTDNGSRVNVCEKGDQTERRIISDMSVKSGVKGSILCDNNGISTGIGFSSKSVLQVSGCNQSYLNDRNNIEEPEPGRCRRTDGKKWRCKCAVLPGQKYCATHMHRGAKKRVTNNETATTTTTITTCSSAVTVARLPYTSATTDIQNAYCRIPKTEIFMSVPASAAPFIECNEKNGSCSDTDTSTTITDTMNEYSYVSF